MHKNRNMYLSTFLKASRGMNEVNSTEKPEEEEEVIEAVTTKEEEGITEAEVREVEVGTKAEGTEMTTRKKNTIQTDTTHLVIL